MDDHGGSDLSIEDLMDEYSSRPTQIAEWLWCIEYVAKFVKDISCLLDLMNIGYQYSNDYGRRINEVLSLRVLKFMFDPSKYDANGVGVASTSEAKVEFDLSLSNTDVLRAILKEIPVSELRAGMPELSKFDVLPFIAHKNMCLPQCALEKLRDVSLMENQTSAAPSMETNDPVFRDDRSVHMDICEEEPVDEQQVHIGNEKEPIDEQQVHIALEQNIIEKDKVIAIDDEDNPMHTNDKGEVIVIDDDTERDQDTTAEPINNGNTTDETFSPSSRRSPKDARVKCTKDGTWLISGSDDESDTVKDPPSIKKNPNTYLNLLPSSSRTRPENVCWKCEKEGTLLICSRSECAAKIHKECLKCPVNVDEAGNFLCPLCWYDRVAMEYNESQRLIGCAKRRLVKCFPVLSIRSKRLK
ncbi:Zinc finger FYVE/PHD-type [Arabidopsis thaliana x Arabidopsis arenosa]|nr:Zinc finger FYVE/PHD-type [Arabidopsis thaliana x Arabidopsis arenosa]KAG7591704.1 Zinc finger FYVE/PHD-type [Arabidopsis thaliana x Arabidopsis arenosa]KAG7591706.1 Zinc finger FYVE/PHD-type [Arabidopsis thaliana x Arabidopsis arenosa]